MMMKTIINIIINIFLTSALFWDQEWLLQLSWCQDLFLNATNI